MDFVLLVLSFMVILAGALLFTNAVEWIGHRLELGEGAVGSLLAAVGTAMPETLIATLAMGLVGLTAYLYRHRRSQGIELRAHVPTLDRDLIFFLVFFGLALALGFGAPEETRLPAGILFFCAYPIYVWRTLVREAPSSPRRRSTP